MTPPRAPRAPSAWPAQAFHDIGFAFLGAACVYASGDLSLVFAWSIGVAAGWALLDALEMRHGR